MSTALPGPLQRPFFFFHSRSFIQHVDTECISIGVSSMGIGENTSKATSMCIVAKLKHIRSHPSHWEVWAGSICICLPLHLPAGPWVFKSIADMSHMLGTFIYLFSPVVACLQVFMIHPCVYAFVYWWIRLFLNAAIQLLFSLFSWKWCSNSVDLIKTLFHLDGVVPKYVFPHLHTCPKPENTMMRIATINATWFYTAFIKQK